MMIDLVMENTSHLAYIHFRQKISMHVYINSILVEHTGGAVPKKLPISMTWACQFHFWPVSAKHWAELEFWRGQGHTENTSRGVSYKYPDRPVSPA